MTVLFKRHFQIAYLVDDVAAGMAEFGENYGVAKWHVMDMMINGPGSPTSKIALAWTDEDMMVELIEPNPAVSSIFSDWRRDLAPGPRFHHLGFMPSDDAEFDAIVAQLGRAGCPVAGQGSVGETLRYAYVDATKALGHYYELVLLKGEGRTQFFAPVPRN